jgi:hypothetical protein
VIFILKKTCLLFLIPRLTRCQLLFFAPSCLTFFVLPPFRLDLNNVFSLEKKLRMPSSNLLKNAYNIKSWIPIFQVLWRVWFDYFFFFSFFFQEVLVWFLVSFQSIIFLLIISKTERLNSWMAYNISFYISWNR